MTELYDDFAEDYHLIFADWEASADFRTLSSDVPGEFDVVLSADNAVPHLQSDDDLIFAGQNMYSKVRQDGLLVITLRDYDGLLHDKPRATEPRVFDNGKRIAFQVWDWAGDSKTYTVNLTANIISG